MSLCPCPGKIVIKEMKQRLNHLGGSGYISVEEKRYLDYFDEVNDCSFPNCPCSSKDISGKLLEDRLDYIIQQAKTNPNFSKKDLKFKY